ncbi:hypothetical protein BDB00DRAFT_308142 [Zychaea mexicana]|uniref:uncharacterized protein n=1 Tax=Zychaea mexicana TaxID=64656 RepID=UPI0022FE7C41|nr:uncharacterized protein BDB00DRAFT_308142 [Zychaea mexicana]KAI9494547.1 hypothetical protein BDB00DRAFT_308142 [Zychaea mexicana]
MDISQLCSDLGEEVEGFPSPQSTHNAYNNNNNSNNSFRKVTSIASITESISAVPPSIPDQYDSLPSDVQLPKLRYPQSNNSNSNNNSTSCNSSNNIYEPHTTLVNSLSIHDNTKRPSNSIPSVSDSHSSSNIHSALSSNSSSNSNLSNNNHINSNHNNSHHHNTIQNSSSNSCSSISTIHNDTDDNTIKMTTPQQLQQQRHRRSSAHHHRSPLSPSSSNVNVADIIHQCSALCDHLERCKEQSQREMVRQDLLYRAAQTAKDMLASLGMLQEQQQQVLKKNQHRLLQENYDNNGSALITTATEVRSFFFFSSDLSESSITFRRSRPDSDVRPRIKRRAKRSTAGQRCHSCNTTETPEWRRGPDGARTLCNACGLHYSKLLRKGSLTVQSRGFLIENDGDRSINTNVIMGSSNRNNNHQQQQQQQRQARIIQYPIIQVQAKPDNDPMSSSNRVKFVNSEISYPRDDTWRINAAKTAEAAPYVTGRIVEMEDE